MSLGLLFVGCRKLGFKLARTDATPFTKVDFLGLLTDVIMEDGLLSLKWNNHKTTFFDILRVLREKVKYEFLFCFSLLALR